MLSADAIDIMAAACAPAVHPITVQAIVRQESARNPYAIGVVGGALVRQPRTLPEAVATARKLEATGWNYSVGLAQINRSNFARLGLSPATAFAPCANLRAMQSVLVECWNRAVERREASRSRWAMEASLACYYSGTLATERHGRYVQGVVAHARSARALSATRGAGDRVTSVPAAKPASLTAHGPSARPHPGGST